MLRVRAAGADGYNNASVTSLDISVPTGSQTEGTNTYPSAISEISWVFSLDDVSGSISVTSGKASSGQYYNGARALGQSISANGGDGGAGGTGQYSDTLAAGYNRFTTVLAGGFDGWDITERDPLRLGSFSGVSDEANAYQLETLKRAINIVSDPDALQYNVVSMPGITQNSATSYLLEKVEDRADALAVIDIQDVYTPSTENASSDETNNGSRLVSNTVTNFEARNLSNSYAATYAPWLLYQDTISSRLFWGPPSIAALGVFSTTDAGSAPWFAPAGFTRGGLSEGAGGIPVVEVSQRYTSDDRDDLYAANINPIAKFPAEGIVFWGQKTLQQTASALDRINVRRLMIFLKREISFIASRLLFAQNTQQTWDRFTGQAEPLLNEVKMQYGIDDFRLILDDTTTTPDLIDRNIIYAKLLVKPTRAVEFFAIDFVITKSGASFED